MQFAITPDGKTIAAGGWTNALFGKQMIYLFDRATGSMLKRIEGPPNRVYHLSFSLDGNALVATLNSGGGIRVFGRTDDWNEVASDDSYGDYEYSLWAEFAGDGTACNI